MSGFLRRLAAQAIGSAEPVRSSSRLPYATAPEPVQEVWQSTQSAAATTEPEQALPAQVSQAPTAPSSATERLANSPRLLIDDVSTEPMRQATSIRLPTQLVSTQGVFLQTQAHSAAPNVLPAAPNPATDDTQSDAHTDSRPNPLPLTPETVLAPTEPLQRVRAVTALLPPQPLRHTDSSVATERLPATGVSASAVEETTEVHVNIGRIEITAVHEAPPPRREPAGTRSKPMTLEDYLAKRSGGRP